MLIVKSKVKIKLVDEIVKTPFIELKVNVNDESNNKIYSQYKDDADKLDNVHFGGRLAEYKYYDMHQIIESALSLTKNPLI